MQHGRIPTSTHAPVWGANWARQETRGRGQGLQLPPPVWGGLFICTYASKRQKATTHAPCAGTNKGVRSICCTRVSFNSRPHAGANDSHQVHTNPIGNFNSRPPCGGEPTWAPRSLRLSSFNSRPRVGEPPPRKIPASRCTVLQLTPPCGGEPYGTIIVLGELRAPTHAPVWGRTSDTCQICWPTSGFNSRPRTGANLT